MMLTSVKNAEMDPAEQIYKGRLVDCGHRVYDCRRRDVTEQQRAAVKAQNLVVRPVSATEWRTAFAVEAAASLDDGYEMTFLLADEKQAYVKTRRPQTPSPDISSSANPTLSGSRANIASAWPPNSSGARAEFY